MGDDGAWVTVNVADLQVVKDLTAEVERLTRENEHLRAERAMWMEEWDLLHDQLEHLRPSPTEPADGL